MVDNARGAKSRQTVSDQCLWGDCEGFEPSSDPSGKRQPRRRSDESLGPAAAEVSGVEGNELLDAHGWATGDALNTVRQAIIPTRPVQLAHRHEMAGQVVR